MKKNKSIFFRIFKFLVVAAALINLAALFLFDYKIPDFLTPSKESSVQEKEVSSVEEPSGEYSIEMLSDSFSYDGTGTLDLLNGVTLKGPEGTVSNAKIFAHIKTGDSLSRKIVEYTADTPQGQVSASRNLKLDNYKGPSITLPSVLPQIEANQLDSILTAMPSDGSFRADDGYGNDITGSVKASYTADPDDASLIHYVFTITNSYNDSVSVAADLKMVNTK